MFLEVLTVRVTALFDLTLYYDIGFLDVFLQATRLQFSKQRCLAFITASIKEANQTALGHFSGSVRELLIQGCLGLSGRPPPPISTMVIRWKPPQAGWHKVNVDGSAPLSPGPIFAGAIFRNSRGFFLAAFSKAVGWGFPLEAELAAILHDILFVFDYGWHSLWVESDSILGIHTLQNRIQIVPWRLQGLSWRSPICSSCTLIFYVKATRWMTLLLSFTPTKFGLARLNGLLAQHQAYFMQKNRAQWFTDGDCNTKFFHTLHNMRKSSDIMNSMYIGDILSHNSDAIGVHVVNFFTELFSARAGGPHDFSILCDVVAHHINKI
ncbi:hypothetical protein ACS0TY_018338 [Phlomoides rotata]